MTEFRDADTLGVARQWLRDQAANNGGTCPCCTQFTKIYDRPIGSHQARWLIRCWQRFRLEPFHQATQARTAGGDYAKLRFWELIQDMREVRADGGPAGWWQVTELGGKWVRGEVAVPKRALVFNNRRLRYEDEGGWTVEQALGKVFNYREIMNSDGGDWAPF